MLPSSLVLALPGDLVSVTESLTHYSTKVGGQPHFPGAVPPVQALERITQCDVCSSPLSLVLQVRCCGRADKLLGSRHS